jgi:preprotein translocase subunit SecG
MFFLQVILIIVEVVSSLLLIGLILLQKTKSQGLGLAFGSGMGEALFGSRAGNVLSRLTVGFATAFMLNTLFLAMLFSGQKGKSLMQEKGLPITKQVAHQAPVNKATEAPSTEVPAGSTDIPFTGTPAPTPTPPPAAPAK